MLRYWSSDLDLEVAPWFPFGLDYQPVSINLLHSSQLKKIASRCLELGSELFFISSTYSGCVGSFMRDNFYKSEDTVPLRLGFMMILGYSPQMERLIFQKIPQDDGLKTGLAFCSLWNKTLQLDDVKIIALVSDEIVFDEEKFLSDFEKILDSGASKETSNLTYFAEKFGYRRFYLSSETDNPLALRITKLLYEMELSETREMLGPSPEMPFPQFFRMNWEF